MLFLLWKPYTYDSLGNLTLETGLGSHSCDYIYNNLNQQIDRSSDNWKSHTASTYDKRGNLVLEEYGKNKKLTTAGAYTFDETNKMVRGVNGNAEESIYTYNGLGALMEQTWIIAKNGYGYHDVSAVETPEDPTPEVPDPGETPDPEEPEQPDPGINNEGNGNNNGNNGNGHVNGNNGNHYGNDDADDAGTASAAPDSSEPVETAANTVMTAALVAYGNAGNGNNGNNGNGNGNQDKPTGSDVKKTSTVVKQFVVDFSSETYKPLMEHEVNGLDYRYVYSDKARLSVVVQGIENGSASLLDDKGELHAYYHCDYLGTTDYLTSAVNSKVISWTSYSEWGEITHNAVLKCGQRELDLVKEYATHDFDAVLNFYYAKARFYDADNRRFTAVDPILDPSRYDLREYVTDPMQLVQTLYVKDNAIVLIDPLGKYYIYEKADSDGNTYYHFSRQYLPDSMLQGLTSVSLQRLIGNPIAGSSMEADNLLLELETLYAVEIEQFKQSLRGIGPYGEMILSGWSIAEKAITAVVDVPAALDIYRRDVAIQNMMHDAQAKNENYSKEFISAIATLDDFVKENGWVFTKYKSLGNLSPYEVGKALATGNKKRESKALTSYLREFSPYYQAQVLNEVMGPSIEYWLDYYQKVGCFPVLEYSRTYPPVKSKYIPALPTIKTTKQEAWERVVDFTIEQFNTMEELYNQIKTTVSGKFA